MKSQILKQKCYKSRNKVEKESKSTERKNEINNKRKGTSGEKVKVQREMEK